MGYELDRGHMSDRVRIALRRRPHIRRNATAWVNPATTVLIPEHRVSLDETVDNESVTVAQ